MSGVPWNRGPQLTGRLRRKGAFLETDRPAKCGIMRSPSCDVPFGPIGDLPLMSREPRLLSGVLESLPLHSGVPGRLELTAPWGIHVDTRPAWFYLVSRNSCLVEVEGHGTIFAQRGDLIFVSQARCHAVRDSVGSPTIPMRKLLDLRRPERNGPLVHGGGGAATCLFCGCFLLDGLERGPLREAVPAVIHVRGERHRPLRYLDYLLRLIELEANDREPSAPGAINRLVKLLFLKAIQIHCAGLAPDDAGRPGALEDRAIGRALEFIHARPDAPWTVASLARRVAMARSTFSARFRQSVGTPPLEYVTQWRMQKAGVLLRNTRLELKEVAAQVGYQSNSAFSKAFARWSGVAPGAYRRARDVVSDVAGLCPGA